MQHRPARRAIVVTLGFSALLALGSLGAPAADGAVTAKAYANCTALNKVYPHGVGRKNAHDHVSGSTRPVTNFRHSNKLYRLNKKSDRDGDKVACEKL